MDDKFSMYVLSNGSHKYYPENTLSKFSVKLPFSFNLPISLNEKWGIALNSICLSSSFLSDYDENNHMPVMIEMLGYADHHNCFNFHLPRSIADCNAHQNELNNRIKKITGYCYDDSKAIKNCPKGLKLIPQLNIWAKNNVKSKARLQYESSEYEMEPSSVYNFFFYTLKDLDSFDKLISDLRLHELTVNKKEGTTYITISNNSDCKFERIFFIRQDFYEKSSITQNTKFIQETNYIIDNEHNEKFLFESYTNAQILNDSNVVFNNITYKIFVLNKEYVSMNIDLLQFNNNPVFLPNLIKIKCNNIKSQLFNNSHSKDIEVIKPDFKDHTTHRFHFHEFENPIYYPLLNTCLRDLTFELTDENNTRLTLSENLPTLLQLNFKRMSSHSKSFSIRLTPKIDDGNNQVNKFTNVLPSILNLNENWRVGLKEITFPSSIKSLPSDENYLIINLLDTNLKIKPLSEHKCKILNDKFNSETLIKYLNEKTAMLNILTFSMTNNSLHVISTTNCEISFSYNLAKFLNISIPNDESIEDKPEFIKMILKRNDNVKIGNRINWLIFRPAYLMIYSDLVKPTLISSEYTEILRIVPVKREEKDIEYQSIEFKNVEFREIANNFINVIKIEIRTHSGELVQFNSNFLSLHLYFTNNPFNKNI